MTAIRDAVARISHGQSSHLLVGGGYNAERVDLFLNIELGRYLARDTAAPVQERLEAGGGMIPGSAGAFLVLESAEHARARGARPYARITAVASDLGNRTEKETAARFTRMIDKLSLDRDSRPAILSGASGQDDITRWELDALRSRFGMEAAIRSYTSMIGNPIEANFPFGLALAAMALKNGHFYEPFEAAEKPVKIPPTSILVSTAGHYRGEGMAMVETAS